MSRETFTIEEIEQKQTQAGKPFYRAKLSGVGYVSVWNAGDHDFLQENRGQVASAEIEQKGDFKNAKGFQKASGTPSDGAGRVEYPNKGGMTPEAWDAKEDRTAVGILQIKHIEFMIEWKTRFPNQKDSVYWEEYEQVRLEARKKAISDLDWRRNYATGDVPFG